MAADQRQKTVPAAASASVRAAAAGQQPMQRHRVAQAIVREVALEQQLPKYAATKPWSSSWASSSSQLRRPFCSLLLAPATQLQPPAFMSPAHGGLDPALCGQLLPGAAVTASCPPAQQQGGSTAAGTVAPAQPHTAAESGGRYFSSGTDLAAAAAQQQWRQRYWQQQYEQLLLQQPGQEQLWLSYAVRHATEAGDGGAPTRAMLTPGVPWPACEVPELRCGGMFPSFPGAALCETKHTPAASVQYFCCCSCWYCCRRCP